MPNANSARLAAVATIARQLMDQHGLSEWGFSFDNSKVRYGVCKTRARVIGLSRHLVLLNSDAENRDTILHEIAHALDLVENGNRGHGPTWKAICVRIGAQPERCYSSKDVRCPEGEWVLRHVETGEIYREFYRRPSRDRMRRVSREYIRGARSETLGKLEIVRRGAPLRARNCAAPAADTPHRHHSQSTEGRWVLRHKITGEVYKHLKHAPTREQKAQIEGMYITRLKRHTLGYLEYGVEDPPKSTTPNAQSQATFDFREARCE